MASDDSPRAGATQLGALTIGWRALRAYSFTATIIPVVCASLTAARIGGTAISINMCAWMLVSALLLHAGTNLLNDYYDYTLGFDSAAAVGSSGLLVAKIVAPAYFWRWGMGYLAAGAVVGLALAATLHNPWLVVLGAFGWLGAFFYSHNHGYKYKGWGEPLVFLMMGPILFCSAYLVASGRCDLRALWVSLPFGCWVASVLLVNNLRDLDMDGGAGFRTLPARIGSGAAKGLFAVLVTSAFALPGLYVYIGWLPRAVLLTGGALIPAAALVRRVCKAQPPYESLAKAPEMTAALYLLYGVLFALGLALG